MAEHLGHQRRQVAIARVRALGQGLDHPPLARRGPVLAQLELPFEARDGDLEADDPAHQPPGPRILAVQAPWLLKPRLVDLDQPRQQAEQGLRVLDEAYHARDVDGGVVPRGHRLGLLVPGGRDVAVRALEEHPRLPAVQRARVRVGARQVPEEHRLAVRPTLQQEGQVAELQPVVAGGDQGGERVAADEGKQGLAVVDAEVIGQVQGAPPGQERADAAAPGPWSVADPAWTHDVQWLYRNPVLILAATTWAWAADPEIQAHLLAVERRLREDTPAYLAPSLRARRLALLDRLHAYTLAGRYPHNHQISDPHPRAVPVPDGFQGDPHDLRTPVFIDAHGTPCAVADLALWSGAVDLAQEIVAHENTAWLLEMRTPGLAAWQATTGLSLEELAEIQPSYGFTVNACDGEGPAWLTDTRADPLCRREPDLAVYDYWGLMGQEGGSGFACYPDCTEQVVQLWVPVANVGAEPTGVYTFTLSPEGGQEVAEEGSPLDPGQVVWHGPYVLSESEWGTSVIATVTTEIDACYTWNNGGEIRTGEQGEPGFPRWWVDADNDAYESAACGGDDCDDANDQVYPGATEVAGDGIDQDCDGGDTPAEVDTGGTAAAPSERASCGCGQKASVLPLLPLLALRRRGARTPGHRTVG